MDGLIRQLVSVNDSQFGFVVRQRQNRCNFCCQAAAREVFSCQQDTLHGFCRPGEGVWFSATEGHLVGAEKTWCGEVNCATCRECIPMYRTVSMLVRGTVKSLKLRSVFTMTQYSARCSSSLCLKLCHASSALGSPGKTSMSMTLLSSLNRLRNASGGSWLGKKQWRRKDWD